MNNQVGSVRFFQSWQLSVAMKCFLGADIEARNWTRSTPLHCAVNSGHLGVMRALIDAGSLQLQTGARLIEAPLEPLYEMR